MLFLALLYVAFPHTVAVLLLSGLLSYALLPLVDRLDRRVPRVLAVLCVGLLGTVLLVLVIGLVAPAVVTQLQGAGQTFDELRRQVGSLWERFHGWLSPEAARWLDRLASAVAGSVRKAAPTGETLARWAAQAGSGVAAVASTILFVPIFSFLMLKGYHRVTGSIQQLVPVRWRERFLRRGEDLDRVLSGFVRGQLLVAAILATMYSIAFSIIGIPLAIVIGLLAGIGELIPYLGNAIALTLGMLLALAGGHPVDALWVAAAFLLIQTIQGVFISPWIVGSRARLSPLTVIVALAVGAQLFGFMGLLLSVPIAALLKVAAQAALDGYRQTRFFRRAEV